MIGLCVRCGSNGASDEAAWDEKGKPSCGKCFEAYSRATGTSDEPFPAWAARTPIASAQQKVAPKCRRCGSGPQEAGDWCAECYQNYRREMEARRPPAAQQDSGARVAPRDNDSQRLSMLLGDAKGEINRLRIANDELTVEVAWLQREVVRLGGKKRGAR